MARQTPPEARPRMPPRGAAAQAPEGCSPEPAGRPLEAPGDGVPRWMGAALPPWYPAAARDRIRLKGQLVRPRLAGLAYRLVQLLQRAVELPASATRQVVLLCIQQAV